MVIKSIFMRFTSTGSLPKLCTASVWKRALCSWQICAISSRGCMVPISLFPWTTDTRVTSSLNVSSKLSAFNKPYWSTGRYETLYPWFSSHFAEFNMQSCSIVETAMWHLALPSRKAWPFTTKLFASVALPVNISSFVSAFIKSAMVALDVSRAALAFRPKAFNEDALPYTSV